MSENGKKPAGKKPKYLGKGWEKVRASPWYKDDFWFGGVPYDRALIEFNEQLFMGVSKQFGLEIYASFDGAIWRPCVGFDAKTSEGFGKSIPSITCAEVFGNDLYVGTDQGGIWWTPDGDTWNQVNLGSKEDIGWIWSIVPFQGRLYAACGGRIYSFNKFGNWTEVTKYGSGATSPYYLAVFKEHLYAGSDFLVEGSYHDIRTEIWRSDDGSKWTNFKKIYDIPTHIGALKELSGYLYIGCSDPIKLFRANGEEESLDNVTDGLNGRRGVNSMFQHGNDLYIGLLYASDPNDTLWISQDGKSWHQFDTKALFGTTEFEDQTISAMIFFKDYLYVKTSSQELWRYGDVYEAEDQPEVEGVPDAVVSPLIDHLIPESLWDEYEKCVVVSYDKEIEKHPEDKWLWKCKGVALFRLGKYQEAIKSYDKAIEIDPNWIDVMTDKGRALAELKNYDMALQYYDKSLKAKSDDTKIWIDKGLVLRKMGKAEDAIMCFNEAIRITSNKIQYTPQHYPGSTSVGINRRKHMSGNLEKLRDIPEADVVAIMGHRNPGADYASIHPPLKEISEPDCPIRQIVAPTAGAAAGDRIRYSQWADSMYFAPSTPYWRSYWGSMNCKGCDSGTLSGRQIIEARERDIEAYTKKQYDSEMTDVALCSMRGCTVHGHSLRLEENGIMFDMLARTEMGKDGNIYAIKDQVGIPLDKKINLGKPMSEAETKKRTTIFRVDGVSMCGTVGARKYDEAVEALHHMWELRSKWGFRPE